MYSASQRTFINILPGTLPVLILFIWFIALTLYGYIIFNNRIKSLHELRVAWIVTQKPLLSTAYSACKRQRRLLELELSSVSTSTSTSNQAQASICDTLLQQLPNATDDEEYLHRCRVHNDSHVRCLPNLVFIGASKAGTTSLVGLLKKQENVKFLRRHIITKGKYRHRLLQ